MRRGWHGTGRVGPEANGPPARDGSARARPRAGAGEDALRCRAMEAIRIVDVTDEASLRPRATVRRPRLRPPLVRLLGGRGARLEGGPASWLEPAAGPRRRRRATGRSNPFADPDDRAARQPVRAAAVERPDRQPVRRRRRRPARRQPVRPDATVAPDRRAPTAPRKLALLGRGLAVFGSYAKVLLVDDAPAAYAQFGPLSAYPRALRLRELYPQLPDAPLPAVITCIATTARGARARPCPPSRRGRLRRSRRARLRGGRGVPRGRGAARRDEWRDARRSG